MLLLLLACAPDDPPAETRCDGRDDDRDGTVDEGLERTWYADNDGDGHGTDATALTTCEAPEGYAEAGGDCDDGDAAAHPGAVETCATPADEDCDGAADPVGAAGCVDTWADADGDGLGEGEPTCVCDPGDAATAGGDCDGTDVDRGRDCAEGAESTLAGARLLLDDGAAYWSLLGAGALAADGSDALALVSTDQRFLVATVPIADTPLSAATQAVYDAPTWSRPSLGDLDGDGLLDLLAPSGTLTPDGDAVVAAPTLTVTRGPLADAAGAWSAELAPVRSEGAYESLFVAELDGDGVPEGWYVLGSGAGTPGQLGVWRLDGTEVTNVLLAEDEVAGRHMLVTPLGDIDGDGFSDVASYGEDAAGTLVVHRGPLVGFPDAGDADHAVTTPPLDDVVGLGDVDGDGVDDVGLREARIWVVSTVGSGTLADVARARIGPENDAEGDSALFVAAADLGADGARELLVTDTYWPWHTGAGNLRGALYVFEGAPEGVVDARAAERRVYAEEYALFGAFPSQLGGGELAVGAPLEATDLGVGTIWVLDGW